MPTLRIDAKPANTGAHPDKPSYYPSRFKIICAPTVGKRGCQDVALVKTAAAGTSFKQGMEVVRAWRGRSSGASMDAALAEAHTLRDTLDASLRDLKHR
jgi:hypothetical protein